MKSLWFEILLLCLVVARQSLSRPLQPKDVVDDTCRTMPYPDFCVSTLRSDPKSATVNGSMPLGVILLDHMGPKANATLRKIQTLISQAKGTKLKRALSNCHFSYAVIVKYSVPESRGALILWNPMFAEEYMNDAASEMISCDEEFKGLENPLRSENDFVHKAASIVAAIARIME